MGSRGSGGRGTAGEKMQREKYKSAASKKNVPN